MIRRRFLGLLTLAGAGGATALSRAARAAKERATVRYRVSGFTCITCATGLETLLGREKGVLAVKASYPDGTTTVSYDAQVISQEAIVAAIERMGFKTQPLPSA